MAKQQDDQNELKGLAKSLHEFNIEVSALPKNVEDLEFLAADLDAIVERLKALNQKAIARRPRTTDKKGV